MIAGCGVSAILEGIMFTCDYALAGQALDDLACCDDLAGVTLGMFCRVEEQPENIAGAPATTDRANGEELLLRHLLQAAHRIIYGQVNKGKQLLRRCRRIARVRLSARGRKLVIPDGLPTCIREEPVHAPADMAKMETDRSSPARLIP